MDIELILNNRETSKTEGSGGGGKHKANDH